MTEISPGAIVTCPRATGTILWVCVGKYDDDIRWKLRSRRTDNLGRTDLSSCVSGAGDIRVIREAPTYAPHTIIEHEGKFCEVESDDGDSVSLLVPAHSRPLADRKSALHYEAGHRITLNKGELVLAQFIADYMKRARAR